MTKDAQRVLDFIKRAYWPNQNRCHQGMAIQFAGGLSSSTAAKGLDELIGLGLIEDGPGGGFCLTNEGLRAVGAAP